MNRIGRRAITGTAALVSLISLGIATPTAFAVGTVPVSATARVPTATHGVATRLATVTAKATSASRTGTLRFIAVETFSSPPTKAGAFYQAYVDVRNGVNVSQSVLSCVAAPTSINCSAALADAKGILLAQFQINTTNGTSTGTVTGGTGGYAGATGTLAGHAVPAGEALTITYSIG